MGGHLVTINDQEENEWVWSTFTSLASEQGNIWIGLNDAEQEGEFVWSSGEMVSFTNWAPHEPNNMNDEDYAHIVGAGYSGHAPMSWNDILNSGLGGGGLVTIPHGVVEISSPLPSSCDGDFDRDGDVDGSDLAVFAADFGRTDCEAEILGNWFGDEVNGQSDSWGFIFSCNGVDTIGPQEWYRGPFFLNKSTDPFQIDCLINTSYYPELNGKTCLGIYKIENGTLTIAINGPGVTTRPSDFVPNGTRVFELTK